MDVAVGGVHAQLDVDVGGVQRGAGHDVPDAARLHATHAGVADAAAAAVGTSRLRGLAELRVKESDRLAAMAHGLKSAGVACQVEGDDLVIAGTGRIAGGATVHAAHDHRIAMSFLVLGALAQAPVTVDGAETIETSFPRFTSLMNRLGCRIEQVEP